MKNVNDLFGHGLYIKQRSKLQCIASSVRWRFCLSANVPRFSDTTDRDKQTATEMYATALLAERDAQHMDRSSTLMDNILFIAE